MESLLETRPYFNASSIEHVRERRRYGREGLRKGTNGREVTGLGRGRQIEWERQHNSNHDNIKTAKVDKKHMSSLDILRADKPAKPTHLSTSVTTQTYMMQLILTLQLTPHQHM